MRATYRVLAFIVAGLVVLQASMMAFAAAGLFIWVDEGNDLTAAKIEAGESLGFTGEIGFMIHGMNGMMLIPLVTLILLIVSFFAKVPGGAKWAGLLFLAVVVQVTLGIFGHGLAVLGGLHGANALLVFWLALTAGRRAGAVAETYSEHEAVAATP